MKLPEASSQRAELRHVAVLFADLQGFTRMCERLDPEEVVEILDGIYDRLGLEVDRYGGAVDKVMGDGLMVLFGAPMAHTDNGLRAIMAGLAMQKAMNELQPWVRERLGQGLGLRIGIDAGAVVYGAVGPGSEAQQTVIGDAANVAARLQHVAAPGQVVMSDRARRLASRQIQSRKLGAVQLEGRAQAVESYIAVAPFAPAASGSGAILVGRDAELQRLTAVYSLASSGRPSLVLLTGEAGIGKSRLLQEFVAHLGTLDVRSRPVVLQVRNRWDVGLTYKPFESLMAGVGTRPREDADTQTASSPTARAGDERYAALLAAAAQKAPLVVVVDDWRWADPADGLRLLCTMAAVGQRRIMFVLGGRHIDLPAEPSLAGMTINRLRLPPLTARDSWMVLQQHPAFAALPLEAAETLLERAGGNPSHIIESVDALIEQGHLAPSGDGWKAKESDGELVVPEMLRHHVLSLLDALDERHRGLLRFCAVIGHRFNVSLLCQITGAEEMQVRESLYALVEAGLLSAEASADGSYTFRTELVRSVTYDTMLKRQRRELHRLVGTAMEGHPGASEEELAVHFVRAGSAEKAPGYGLSASRAMLWRGDHKQALDLLSEMEPLIPTDDAGQRAVFLERLGQAYVASGACPEGMDRLLQALAMVREPGWRARLMAELGWAYTVQGKTQMAAKHYKRAQEVMDVAGDPEERTLLAAAMRLLYDRP
ncbi:MAG: adenylate/guanylate cyclase domain-containing protein [Anaerolineae bacterium]